jgi:hypothetical protein
MQKKIVEEVEITPEEVRNFFKSIPRGFALLVQKWKWRK